MGNLHGKYIKESKSKVLLVKLISFTQGNKTYSHKQWVCSKQQCWTDKKGILDFLIHLGSKFATNMSQFILKDHHPQTTHQMALSLGTVTLGIC